MSCSRSDVLQEELGVTQRAIIVITCAVKEVPDERSVTAAWTRFVRAVAFYFMRKEEARSAFVFSITLKWTHNEPCSQCKSKWLSVCPHGDEKTSSAGKKGWCRPALSERWLESLRRSPALLLGGIALWNERQQGTAFLGLTARHMLEVVQELRGNLARSYAPNSLSFSCGLVGGLEPLVWEKLELFWLLYPRPPHIIPNNERIATAAASPLYLPARVPGRSASARGTRKRLTLHANWEKEENAGRVAAATGYDS